MCASRAASGCCSYEGAVAAVRVFTFVVVVVSACTGWSSATCVPAYGTAKCRTPQVPYRVRRFQPSLQAACGTWRFRRDQFDSDSCVVDSRGIRRPSPEFWSAEVGYKRGKELQWYQPENAECKNGELVITAKRERQPWEKPEGSQCRAVAWSDKEQTGQKLDNQSCAVCAPPYFQYYNPCDLQRTQDDMVGPACDCSHTAEFTSASLMTRGKKDFSYGLFELRAKIDTRPGAWPSWWAVGRALSAADTASAGFRAADTAGDFDFVPWPKNGEIDILDAFQRTVKASVTHAGESGFASSAIQHAGARMVDRDWEKYYHIWQLEWDERFIEIRVDGESLLKVDLSVADPQRTSWPNPFTRNKSLRRNPFGVGGPKVTRQVEGHG
ncbi:3-1 [Durusdinium trenchii]|uniref:3-1 n=1 Tax=Durusdinium trenchii TaxID=1381693 RepID=A0ABP0I7N8_9DINO